MVHISLTGYWYLATSPSDFCTTETALLRSPALEGHPRNSAAGHPFPNGKAEAELVLLAITTGTEGWKQNWPFKIQHTYQLASGKICLVDYKAQSFTSFLSGLKLLSGDKSAADWESSDNFYKH